MIPPNKVIVSWFLPAVTLLLLAIYFTTTVSAGSALNEISIEEAERLAITSRRSIEAGHFVVRVRYNIFVPDPSYLQYEQRYEIFLSKAKRRTDTDYRNLSSNQNSLNTVVFTKDSFIRAPMSDDAVVQFFGPDNRPSATIEVPDPRLLGFVPWNFASISQFGLEEYLMRPDRLELKARRGERRGEQVLEVSYHVKAADEIWFVEYWLAANKNWQPIYVSTWSGEGDQRILRSVESTLDYNETRQLWFPRTVVFRAQTGSAVTQEEVSTIDVVDLTEISDSTFTLAGIGLKPGRLVLHDGQYMWWTGERLVPKIVGQDEYRGDQLQGEEERKGIWRRILLAANAVALAIIGTIFLWRKIRKRQ